MMISPHNADTPTTTNSSSNKKSNNTPLTNNSGISSLDHVTNKIGILSLDHVSEKASIEDEYPNFNNKFNSNLLSGSEGEDYGYKFPLNDYLSEKDDAKSSFLLPIPTLTTDKYKMGWKTNDEVEVKVEFNSFSTSDDSTITNDQY